MSSRTVLCRVIPVSAVCLLLLAAAIPADAAAKAGKGKATVAPAGKSYALGLLIRDPESGQLEGVDLGCFSFTEDEVCNFEGGECGAWEFISQEKQRNHWKAELVIQNDDGTLIPVVIHGMTERMGQWSSIAGTVRASFFGITVNAGFGGVQMPPAVCEDIALSDEG